MMQGKELCFLMCGGARLGAPIEGVECVQRKTWVSNLGIKAEQIDDPERIAAALRRKRNGLFETHTNVRQRKEYVSRTLSGNAGQKCLNGDYVAVEGMEKNNRPVYRFTGPEALVVKVCTCISMQMEDGELLRRNHMKVLPLLRTWCSSAKRENLQSFHTFMFQV